MSDLISRQAAIDTVRSYYDECDEREESIEERIERLPSAERHGKWLEHKDYPGLAYLCSECNLFTTDRSFYCPHCGAKMDEVT